ncbi:helix-turn-helix domain-containing protein [Nocardioides alkalitolerans]|uniref:helix-turn-helix domain-containing protein n=1 Tax=Nocardioides alkalitolerans TaxID=281714 RepID=UPI00041C4903|nr:helix-turn-helix domain-containing protein [Nocardioides alkalitolerans]
MTTTNRQLWLSVTQAAEVAQRHPVTVRKALAEEKLHGHQRAAGASWRIHADCLEAWLRNEPCPCAAAPTGVTQLHGAKAAS